MEIQTDNPESGFPFPCYSFDENKNITLNTAYILTSNTVDIRYILGILNSSTGRVLTKLYVTQLQERQFRMLAQYVCNFPIPKANIQVIGEIVQLVITRLQGGDKYIEKQIDNKIYKLFGFSQKEILFIENRGN